MKPGAKHGFLAKFLVLCLAALLGMQGATGATASRNKQEKRKTTKYNSKRKPNKTKKGKKLPQTTKRKTTKYNSKRKPNKTKKGKKLPQTTKPSTPSKPLKKPRTLSPARLTQEDPLVPLDLLVVKQQGTLAPYVPLVQAIDLAVDYGRLAMNLWTPKERRYVGSLSILFRKNVQLSGTLGYNRLPATPDSSNTVEGVHGCLGLAYFIKYDRYSNLYTGVRYGIGYFKHSVKPTPKATSNQSSRAAWWELVLGSEQQLLHNWGLYAGFILHLKGLKHFETFAPATNHTIPGYGWSVQKVAPSITLYIKYTISFLAKKISFNESLTR